MTRRSSDMTGVPQTSTASKVVGNGDVNGLGVTDGTISEERPL